MAAAARGLGRPGAADAVAALVLALAERRPLPPVDAIERDRAGRRPRDRSPRIRRPARPSTRSRSGPRSSAGSA